MTTPHSFAYDGLRDVNFTLCELLGRAVTKAKELTQSEIHITHPSYDSYANECGVVNELRNFMSKIHVINISRLSKTPIQLNADVVRKLLRLTMASDCRLDDRERRQRSLRNKGADSTIVNGAKGLSGTKGTASVFSTLSEATALRCGGRLA